MTYGTINDAQTIAGGGTGTVLARRYRVVRQLGHGGMGDVWLAEDMQLDNKSFAIKMLPSILVSNKRAYRQLKEEARVAMRLIHPNIVQIRTFEENNGNPFLVMDYIEGQTLDDYLCERGTGNGERGSGLSEEETIRVLRPIAAALDYAHGEGVVHRDVKPANVMIRKDGHPFILDFGIAREIQETMTRVTGKLSSGTLLYMSPEQLNGDKPTPAQDIYSFAAMAYECLKGEPPFVRGAIEDQIKNKIPEPLVCTGRTGGSPVANAPAARSTSIAPSVMAGLAKKPEDRPKNCVAVLEGESSNRVERAERVEGDGGFSCVERAERVEGEGFSNKERKERKGGGVAWKVILEGVLGWIKGHVLGQKAGLGNQAEADSSTITNKQHIEHSDDGLKTGATKNLVLPGGEAMEMIYCAPGEYIKGSLETEVGRETNEKRRLVRIKKGFWLGKYPVTQRQWESVMGTNPSYFKGEDLPVDSVSRNDCEKFIKKVNAVLLGVARLPGEDEWEYACRAGTKTAYSWGNALNGDRANCVGKLPYGITSKGPCMYKTTDVGRYGSNPWGFCDMHGNIKEWCLWDKLFDLIAILLVVVTMLTSIGLGWRIFWWILEIMGLPSGSWWLHIRLWVSTIGITIGITMVITGIFAGVLGFVLLLVENCLILPILPFVLRGGAWDCGARECRSASRSKDWAIHRKNTYGFRLCCNTIPPQ